jgi:hypothetical protein
MADLDKSKITHELEQLQLEELRDRVQQSRNRRAGQQRRRESIRAGIRRQNETQAAKKANCWHKKGGKGVEQLARGNDSNYAVVKHILPTGELIIVCQRCEGEWHPPDTRLNRRTATKEEKAEYRRLWEEYMWAVNLPTDNTTSGTQLFVVNDAAA